MVRTRGFQSAFSDRTPSCKQVQGLAQHTLLIAKDGTERPIDDSAAPIRGKAGEVVGSVLVFRDVTARHQAEEELRRGEERFRDTFEQAAVSRQST